MSTQHTPDADDAAFRTRRRAVVGALLVVTLLASLDVTIVSMAVPTIIAELSGLSLFGWVFSAYMLASTITVPAYGKLADRFGRKPVFVLGLAFFLSGSLLCGFAWSMPTLIVARAIQGLGAGALIPVAMTIVGDLYDVKERARVQGVFSLVWGVSSIIGPLVGAFMLEHFTWPWIFWVNLPTGACALLALHLAFREDVSPQKAPIDIKGQALLALTASSLLFALEAMKTGGYALGAGFIVLFALSAVLLFVVEKRAQDPVIPVGLLTHGAIRVHTMCNLFTGAFLFSLVAFTAPTIIGVFRLAPVFVAGALVPSSLGWTAGAWLSGIIYIRAGYRRALIWGTAVTLAGAAALWYAVDSHNAILYCVASGLAGIGFGVGITTMNVQAQDIATWRERGAATSWLQFSRSMGGAIGITVLGIVFFLLARQWLSSAVDDAQISLLLDPERWPDAGPAFATEASPVLWRAMCRMYAVFTALAATAAVFALFSPAMIAGSGAGEQERLGRTRTD